MRSEGPVDSGVPGALRLNADDAVRALAGRLNVDLAIVTPTGPDDTITPADVERVHRILRDVGPLERLTGARRTMARTMGRAREEVMHAMVADDAVLSADLEDDALTLRLVRAMIAAVKREPALNAWFDSLEIGRRRLDKIHLGIAVETADGPFVCVMQDVGSRSPESLRAGLARMREDTRNHRVPPEELRGYTLMLADYGASGGRYATPAVVPPTVAVVAAGSIRDGVVAVGGRPAVCPVLPVTVGYDQRAVTGAEAGRFLSALIADLQAPG